MAGAPGTSATATEPHGGAHSPPPRATLSKQRRSTDANRSPLPDTLQRLRVALAVVPHPRRGAAHGRLLPELWVTFPHRPFLPRPVRPMSYPAFLDNQQIEELETFGIIELTETMLDQLLAWSFGDEPLQLDT